MFCLGIDHAVNGSVLKRFATLSSGACELVASEKQVEKQVDEAMHRFADEIGPPAVVGLKIEAEGGMQWQAMGTKDFF